MGSYGSFDFTLTTATADRSGATYPEASSASVSWRKFRVSDLMGGEAPSGSTYMGVQALRFSVVFSVASETCVLQTAIVDTQESTTGSNFVVWATTQTCTAGAIRTNQTGDGGGYVGVVVDSITGRDTVDLLGHLGKNTEVYIGLTTDAATGTVHVRVAPTRDA